MEENRIIETTDLPGDSWQYSLRPHYLREYIGQDKVKDNLEVFIKAAKLRKEALDHVLLYGPPGLGKTTMAGIIANELGVNLRITSGPAIERPGDLAALLTNLQERDLLFIDEIHRLSHSVEEVLYAAMEDYALDIVIGKGPSARSVRIDLPPFTLVGATTQASASSAAWNSINRRTWSSSSSGRQISSTWPSMTTAPWKSPAARGGHRVLPTAS